MNARAKDCLRRIACYCLAFAALVIGYVNQAMATATAHDYSTELDDTFTTLNFSGQSTSFVNVLAGKAQPLMIGVISVVVIAGIVWRLSGKTKKIAG